jgi:hypothetical protein
METYDLPKWRFPIVEDSGGYSISFKIYHHVSSETHSFGDPPFEETSKYTSFGIH